MGYLTFRQRSKIPDYFNPEQVVTGQLCFDSQKCSGCGICVSICPAGGLLIDTVKSKNQKVIPYHDIELGQITCIGCGCCLAACRKGAINFVRGFQGGYLFARINQTKEMLLPRKY
ncbi:MAG: 4Fe-4S dicluster domain-containing protein [Ignavibacteriales bacterium]